MTKTEMKCQFISDYIYHRTGVRIEVTPRLDEIEMIDYAFKYALLWFRFNQVRLWIAITV